MDRGRRQSVMALSSRCEEEEGKKEKEGAFLSRDYKVLQCH